MPSTFFRDFLKHATRNVLKTEGINAQKFISDTANKLEPIEGKILADRPRDLSIGSMYLFIYDAKWKKELPYWDLRPLIFPISRSGDRFMGLNFHYLPVQYRAMLMDALYDFANTDEVGDPERYLNISYQILNGIAKYKYFKPTVHLYLNKQVRSRFIWIPATQWMKTLLLPLQQWRVKGGVGHPNSVYADSIRKMG